MAGARSHPGALGEREELDQLQDRPVGWELWEPDDHFVEEQAGLGWRPKMQRRVQELH